MKRAKLVIGCAVLAVLFVVLQVSAQFGGGESSAPQAGSSLGTEQAVLNGEALTASEKATGFCQCIGESKSPSVAKIKQALGRPLKSEGLAFTDTPLEEVVNLLHEDYGVQVQMDTRALEEVGIDATEPVTASLNGISLSAALRLILKPLQLTYVVENEVLMITTSDEAEKHLVSCVYDVRDLLPRARRERDFDSLIDTIVSCIATESWAENGGGESEIRPLQPGFLVISQTASVHNEIQELLNTIRQMKSEPLVAATDAALHAPSDELVTEAYRLQIESTAMTDQLRGQIQELIAKAFPEERWDGSLDNGQSVLLAVLHDRVIVRHKPAVQDAVEELLTDSELVAPYALLGPLGAHGCGSFGNGGLAPTPAKDAKLNQK